MPINQSRDQKLDPILSASSNIKPALGFIDDVLASQSVFRSALSALAQPTRKIAADFESLFKTQPPLPYGVAALALTLLDHLTTFWLSYSFARAASFLAFHTGAPLASKPEKADFLLVASLEELPALKTLNQGAPRYPDRSATIIMGDILTENKPSPPLIAHGPGLKEETLFSNHGLDERFVADWAFNRAAYPLGVDAFLTGSNCLVGLPRSLSLRLKS
jgi:alpha-D-ribose 1-methylphosphonate 5-triphosphate synthase subunit PhnH